MDSHMSRSEIMANTFGLDIPIKLAFILDKNYGRPQVHSERNLNQVVTSAHSEPDPSKQAQLPSDIDDFVLTRFLGEAGCQLTLGTRGTPINQPFLTSGRTEEDAEDAVAAFKLILRLLNDEKMTISQEFLMGSYLYQMALCNEKLLEEIFIQLMSQSLFYTDEVGQRRLWMHMANLLSCCRPTDRLYFYVLKFVSDHAFNGYRPLCQRKALNSKSPNRAFPPSSLEWRANSKAVLTALQVTFPDDEMCSVEVESFTTGKDLAKHALLQRFENTIGLAGWSVAFHKEGRMIEPCGHGYVLDVIAAMEMPSQWPEIGGQREDNVFLISDQSATYGPTPAAPSAAPPADQPSRPSIPRQSGPAVVNPGLTRYPMEVQIPHSNSTGLRSRVSSEPTSPPAQTSQPQHRFIKAGIHPTTKLVAGGKQIERRSSERSGFVPDDSRSMRTVELDNWLDDVFDSVLKTSDQVPERLPSPRTFIHGVGDSLAQQGGSEGHHHHHLLSSSPLVAGAIPVSSVQGNISAVTGTPALTDDMATVWPTVQLQSAIQQAQMQNALLQHNLQTELLKSQINQIRLVNHHSETLMCSHGSVISPYAVGNLRPAPGVDEAVQQHDDSRHHRQRRKRSKSPMQDGVQQSRHTIEESVLFVNGMAAENQVRQSQEEVSFEGRQASPPTIAPPPVPLPAPISAADVDQLLKKTTQLVPMSSDTPHMTYTRVPWSILVRKEVLLPSEKVDHPLLLDLIFYQIVRDVFRGSCVRLTQHDEEKMKRVMESYQVTALGPHLRNQPVQTKKGVLEVALTLPFYFGRFYPVQIRNSNRSAINWMVVSHTGIRLVNRQRENLKIDELNCRQEIGLNEIQSVQFNKEDSNLSIVTSATRFDLQCQHGDSAKYLIEICVEEFRKIPATNGSAAIRKKKHVSKVKQHNGKEKSSWMMEDPVRDRGDVLHVAHMRKPKTDNPMLEYARMYFKARSTGADMNEMLRWGRTPIHSSLLQHSGEFADKVAVESFLAIMTFMNDYPTERDTVNLHYAFLVLEVGHKYPELIDEVFCQLCKQTTNNDSQESLTLGWRLFAIFALFYPCSPSLQPFLVAHVQQIASQTGRHDRILAATTLQYLIKSIKYGGRKRLPEERELAALVEGCLVKRQMICLPGDTATIVCLKPSAVVDDLIEDLCSQFGVNSPAEREEFNIFSVVDSDGVSSPVKKSVYVFDLTTILDDKGKEHHLFFCRTSWLYSLRMETRHEAYAEFLYNQVCDEYNSGHWTVAHNGCLSSEQINQIAFLAALKHRANDQGNAPSITEVRATLPDGAERLCSLTPQDWVLRVQNAFDNVVTISPFECKMRFVDTVSKWERFGCACFAITLSETESSPTGAPGQVHFCVGVNGVAYLDGRTHEDLVRYPLTQVLSYHMTKDSAGRSRVEVKLVGDKDLMFFPTRAHTILLILRQYVKAISKARMD